jgi:hypothetical protein
MRESQPFRTGSLGMATDPRLNDQIGGGSLSAKDADGQAIHSKARCTPFFIPMASP